MISDDDSDRRDFFRLFDALIDEPWKVKAMVNDEPALLSATNLSGETVIHWFIVENDFERVKLLYDCGAPIDPYALVEACSVGHVGMCELLLCYGVIPDVQSCIAQMRVSSLTRATRTKLRAVFRAYGYPLTEA